MSSELRRRNRAAVREDVRLRRGIPEGLPLRVRVETSSVCRLRCLHCYKTRAESPGVFMDPRIFRRVVEEVVPTAEVLELGLDGEPLHDKNLGSLLAMLPDDGPPLEVMTSGDGLLSALPILLPRLRRLVISTEVFDETDYPAVRVGGDFRGLLRSLEAFRRAAARQRHPPALGFRLTLFRGSLASLPALVHRLAREGARFVDVVFGVALEREFAAQTVEPNDPSLAMVFARAAHQARLDGIFVRLPCFPPPEPYARKRRFPLTRDAALHHHLPWTHATIDLDGMVSLCCPPRLLGGSGAGRLGDLSFAEAWRSEALFEIRTGLRSREGCMLCPHRAAQQPS